MKRIIFLKSRMHKQGGLEKYLDRLARLYSEKGYDVTVLTSFHRDTVEIKRPYRVCSLMEPCSCSWLHLLLFDRAVRTYLKSHPAEVIFGFDRHFVPLTHYRAGNGCHRAYLAVRSQGMNCFRRMLLWMNPLHWITLLSEKRTLSNLNTTIICNSNMVRAEFLRYYPKASIERIVVIHNGAEWSEYEEPFQHRQKNTVPHLLFVGNEWQRKGVEWLLRGLVGVSVPFHCTIVGKEKHHAAFETLASSLGLDGRVSFKPFHEKALFWYQKSDILVIPSLYDPFANVTVEALSMGLFVVSSTMNGGSEVLFQGETGFILPNLDADTIAETLTKACELVQTKPHLKQTIREQARQFDFATSLKAYTPSELVENYSFKNSSA